MSDFEELRESVRTIIKTSEQLNKQIHGKPRCKSCSLAEALEHLLNSYERGKDEPA